MITRGGAALVATSTALLVASVPTGNLAILAIAAVPLLFLSLGHSDRPPRQPSVRRTMSASPWRLGAPVTIEIVAQLPKARGLVELHQRLPDAFELVAGNNLHVVRHGRDRELRFRFTVRCAKRGTYTLEPLDWSVTGMMGLSAGEAGQAGDPVEIKVKALAPSYKKMVGGQGHAVRVFPDADRSRIGLQTNEFRELRTYLRGDSPRNINWKATARAQSRAGGVAVTPLVNEYEVEGKKRVWLFVDGGAHMAIGSNVENAFEHAVQATLGMARFFIDRGFRVGFSLFNHPDATYLYPELGGRQFQRIQDILHDVEPSDGPRGLPEAVNQARPYLLGGRSLTIVVTRAERADDRLINGLRRLRASASMGRHGHLPVFVVSPDPYGLVPDQHDAAEGTRLVMRRLDRPNIDSLRRLGVEVLRWDPRGTAFQTLLVRRMAAR